MTIDKHIAAIRGMLREHNERDALFTDEALYHHFSVAVAELHKQKIDREKNYDPFSIQYFCIGTVPGKVHDCNCVDVGCDVLRSIYQIPKPISNRSSPFIRVRTLEHQDIPFVDPSAANAINTDPVRKGKLHYSIINRTVILWNTKGKVPKAILVGGLFEDPLEWAGLQLCDPNGNVTEASCFDAKSQDFPVDQDLVRRAYRLTIEAMGIALRKPDDRINDQG